MKKIVALIVISASMITFVSNFSFAEELTPDQKAVIATANIETAYCTTQSSICGTAPEQFTFLMDFVREMMNSIKTIWPQGEYLGKYVNPNRFKWNEFIAPKKTLLGKVATNVANKLKFGLASTAIFSSPVNFAGLKDMLWWVVLLTKNHVFLRDTKLIEKLDTLLNDKKYELGLWWWWNAQIIPENIAIMQGIVNTYKEKWLLVPSSILNPGVSYNNVTSLLTQVLSSAKSFLSLGTTDQFDTITRGGSDQWIFIGFQTGAIATIKRDYTCARWPNAICSSEWKKLKEAWTKMWKSLSFWSAETKKTLKDAVTRLWQIFSPSTQDDKFKAREADLLRSMYGSTKINKWTLSDSLKKTWAGIKKSWTEVGQQFSDLGGDIALFRSIPKTMKDTIAAKPTLPTMPPDTPETTDVGKTIDAYVYDVFVNQQTDLDLVSLSEVKGITPAFAVLRKQVSVIKNDILGGKDKKNTFISSLWGACELQCGRWWLCR